MASVRYSVKLPPVKPSAKYQVREYWPMLRVTGRLIGELSALGSEMTSVVASVCMLVLGAVKVKKMDSDEPDARVSLVGLAESQAGSVEVMDQLDAAAPLFVSVIDEFELGESPGLSVSLTNAGVTARCEPVNVVCATCAPAARAVGLPANWQINSVRLTLSRNRRTRPRDARSHTSHLI